VSQSAIVQSRLTNPALVSLETGLVVLIGLAFALKLHLVFTLNVNWDEFYFLLLEMGLHGMGVGKRHRHGRADAARRADGAGQMAPGR